MTNPLCVALDERDPARLLRLAHTTAPHVGVLKIGLTAYVSCGDEMVRNLTQLKPVFLDLKLHDIPAQVEGAVEAAAALGISYTTIHTSGGADMVKAAVAAAPDHVTILAVTVLTSLDDAMLERIGIVGPAGDAVLRLAEVAIQAGAGGLVCSPHEVAALRSRFGPSTAGGPVLVVPGIRPAGAEVHDQRRTLTPGEALAAGADLLVVGRPITSAQDPAAAAAALVAEAR